MFFQFSPPARPIPQKAAKKEALPEIAVLSLAPFTPNPKIFFENIKIGHTSCETLFIKNPTNRDLQLTASWKYHEEELDVELSWTERTIRRNEETSIEISWTPTVEGAWRHMLSICDNRSIQKDIPVVFKCVGPVKKKVSKIKPKKKPTFLSKKNKSPVQSLTRRKSPLKRPVLPDISNIPNLHFDAVAENGFMGNDWGCIALMEMRRETFVVERPQRKAKSPDIENSLQIQSPLMRAELSFEKRLQSDSFNISQIKTPINTFNPEHCSTDEKSFNNTSVPAKRQCLFPEKTNATFEVLLDDLGNLSCETYVKGNTSTETYVKGNTSTDAFLKGNLSTETYVKSNTSMNNLSSETFTKAEISSSTHVTDDSLQLQITPKSSSQKLRLDSLAGLSVKETVEANLWSNRKNRPLITIKEEQNTSAVSAVSFSLKRKSDLIFMPSPPKRPNLGPRILDWSKRGDSSYRLAKRTSGLTLDKNCISETSTSEVIVTNPFLMSGDPFLTDSLQFSESWVSVQEENFKKWLNSLLTSPLEDCEAQNPDVAKLWSECKNREVETAPSRETVAEKFHGCVQLNALRKKAASLYKSAQVKGVLRKVCKAIELKKIAVRDDRNIHLDPHLQTQIMNVFLSYNPLWLRLALETIYGAVIPMSSNSDFVALTSFISSHYMKDPSLLKKYKSVYVQKYASDLKKSMLKRFFSLVYFLDRAKTNKLIRHDPCLFRKTSQIKESREALLAFSRETLHAVGDITKYLRYFDFVVQHKQTYIHEFDYGVRHLGVDLRDGVRLTRVLEIILLRNDLTHSLRVPAISRLQKVHNMKLVFEALANAGFQIHHDVSPKDIVDGHKEKTLSFLWQLINKFQTPLMVKSATTIQHWWRTECVFKRAQLKAERMKKNAAAVVVQSWWRRRLLATRLEWFVRMRHHYLIHLRVERAARTIQNTYKRYVCRRNYKIIQNYVARFLETRHLAATKIQSFVRMFLVTRRLHKLRQCVRKLEDRYTASKLMKQQKCEFESLKWAVLVTQRRFRANQHGKKLLHEFEVLKYSAVVIQQRFRANQLRRQLQNDYNRLRASVIVIQKRLRATRKMRMVHAQYVTLKWAVLVVQQRFRANKLAQKQRLQYAVLKDSAVLIQRHTRGYLATKKAVSCYNNLRRAAITLQRRFRANKAMRSAIEDYNNRKAAAIQIQRFYRAVCLARRVRLDYEVFRHAVVVVQTRFRAKLLARRQSDLYNKLKRAVLIIQRKRRAQLAMRVQRDEYGKLKTAVVAVQRRYRAKLACNLHKSQYEKLRLAVILVQRRRRLLLETRHVMKSYKELKNACVIVQRRFRALRMMKRERAKYQEFRNAVVVVQRQWRATLEMRAQKKQFDCTKSAIVTLQRRFRAQVAMRVQRCEYEKLRTSVVAIQRRYRAKLACNVHRNYYEKLRHVVIVVQRRRRLLLETRLAMKSYRVFKNASVIVQRKFRALRMMKRERAKYQEFRSAVIVVQRQWRATLEMRAQKKQFDCMKIAIVTLQRRFRAQVAMRVQRHEYVKLKTSVVAIQRRYRAKLACNVQRNHYEKLRHAVILVQRRRRLLLETRHAMKSYNELKNACVIVQRKFRALRMMKRERAKYQEFRNAVVVVQRQWRATLEMRAQKKQFGCMKSAIVTLQRRFRAQVAMRVQRREYEKLKTSVLFVQKQWRAKQSMRIEMKRYGEVRAAALIIQKRFRARQIGRLARNDFESIRNVVVFVQRTWRRKIVARRARNAYQASKRAVLCVQKYARGFLIRRKYAGMLTAEAIAERKLTKLRNKAATRLQSAWRGYKERSNDCQLLAIRKRLQKANDEAIPAKTIASRCTQAVIRLTSANISLNEIIQILEILEFFTRVCQNLCLKWGSLLPESLYKTIISANRSPPEQKACTAAASILINFCRYEPTKEHAFVGEYMEGLLTVMLHSCNKESPLFPTIATLIWLFARNDLYKKTIVSSPKFKEKMERIRVLCCRQREMVAKCKLGYESLFVQPAHDLPLPYPMPDWGLESKNRPKIFRNSVQALNSLLEVLNVTK